MLPLVALMIGALVTALSVALLFALALRKRRATTGNPRGCAAALPEKLKPGAPPGEQQPHVMDINHDHYVVSYTLKSMGGADNEQQQRQPDILTARYGTCTYTLCRFNCLHDFEDT